MRYIYGQEPSSPQAGGWKMNALLIKKLLAFPFILILALTIAPLSLRSEAPATDPELSLPLSSLAIPEEIGKVQERFVGRGTRTIIQIQDVHAHAVAQQNIAAILERLRTMFGVEKTALEGAWSATSLSKSHAIPTSREKQLLAGTLLEDDMISGPVYTAIMSPDPITLVGIEDGELYKKNRGLFLGHLKQAKEITEKIQAYGTSLREIQNSTWNPELMTFGSAFGKFREDSDLGKFLPLLLETANTLSADTSDLTQILLLKNIMALEKSIAKERLDKEVKQVIKKYKNRPWTVEELIRGGKIPAEEIGLYPEIKKLTRLYQMRDGISLRDVMDQIGTLTRRILEKLVKSPEERALWEKTERFYLAKKILLLQATPEDLKSYAAEKPLLEVELTTAGLASSLALSVEFYDTVKKRDEIFFQRITADPALSGDIAVVTGGFHTDGLSQKFRDAGISYITITPELGNTAANEVLYETRMKDDRESIGAGSNPGTPSSIRNPSASTLSELQNSVSSADERFLKALDVLFQTKDVRKAVRVFRGETVAVSNSNKIRDLTARKRLRKNAGPETVSSLDLKVPEFMTLLTHEEQMETVRALMKRADQSKRRPALISSIRALLKIASFQNASALVERALKSGDPIALLKDGELPEELLRAGQAGKMRVFEAEDMQSMILGTPQFSSFILHHPPVVVMNDYASEKYPVLEARPESLILYPIITLSESLYLAAKNNPDFCNRLAGLVNEVLSQEAVQGSV